MRAVLMNSTDKKAPEYPDADLSRYERGTSFFRRKSRERASRPASSRPSMSRAERPPSSSLPGEIEPLGAILTRDKDRSQMGETIKQLLLGPESHKGLGLLLGNGRAHDNLWFLLRPKRQNRRTKRNDHCENSTIPPSPTKSPGFLQYLILQEVGFQLFHHDR